MSRPRGINVRHKMRQVMSRGLGMRTFANLRRRGRRSGMIPIDRDEMTDLAPFSNTIPSIEDFAREAMATLDNLQQNWNLSGFDRDFDRSIGQTIPLVQVDEKKDEYLIHADVPGFKKEDIEVHLSPDKSILTVKGHRDTKEKQETDTIYSERRGYTSFRRSFTLPEGTDAERISAKVDSGVMKISVPRQEIAADEETKKISVE